MEFIEFCLNFILGFILTFYAIIIIFGVLAIGLLIAGIILIVKGVKEQSKKKTVIGVLFVIPMSLYFALCIINAIIQFTTV